MTAGLRRRLYLCAGVGALFIIAGGTHLVPNAASRLTGSPADPLLERVRQLRSEGRYGEALLAARESASTLERTAHASPWRRADAGRLVATLTRITGLPDSARSALSRADRADATIENLRVQGLYRDAATLARDQLAVRTRILGEESPEVARSRATLGDIQLLQGDFLEARALQERALELRRKVLGEKHPDVAQSLEALGLAEQDLNYRDEARSCFRQSLDLRRELFGERNRWVAASLGRQADLLRGDGRGDDAVALFRQALEMMRSTRGPESPETADLLCNLGLAFYWKGDYRGAAPYLRRAVELGHRLPGVSRETLALSSSLYGLVLWAERRYEEAEAIQAESARLYELLRAQGKPGYDPSHPLVIHSQLALTQLERGEQDAAWASLERSLGRSLLDGLEPPDSLVDARGVPGTPDDDRFCSLALVQSHLPDNCALVGWLMAQHGGQTHVDYPIWGYVIRSQGPVHWVRIGPPTGSSRKSGTSAVFELGWELWGQAGWPTRLPLSPGLTRSAQEVYRELVLPLQPYLRDVGRLVVVQAFIPTPVELLIDPAGTYLGERYEVSYTTSATLYVWMREHARPPKDPRSWRVLAVGGAVSTGAGNGYDPLPGSRAEVGRLSAIFPRTSVLLGEAASKESLARLAESRRLGDFDLIHLAVHAHVNHYATESAIILSGLTGSGTSDSATTGKGHPPHQAEGGLDAYLTMSFRITSGAPPAAPPGFHWRSADTGTSRPERIGRGRPCRPRPPGCGPPGRPSRAACARAARRR